MTENYIKSEKSIKVKSRIKAVALTLFPLFIIYLLTRSTLLREGAIFGARLALLNLLPTLFPFFILSDLWKYLLSANGGGRLLASASRVLAISQLGLRSLLIGLISGFPGGARLIAEDYSRKNISREECEFLLPLCGAPSPAFIISGVGVGVFSDIVIGFRLYLSVFISTLLLSLYGRKRRKVENPAFISRQTFSLVDSIESAAFTSIRILAFIVFFSALESLILPLIPSQDMCALLSPLIEIASGLPVLYNSSIPKQVILPLTAFFLGFSGICGLMQVLSFLPKEISRLRYIKTKLALALLSAPVSLFLFIR